MVEGYFLRGRGNKLMSPAKCREVQLSFEISLPMLNEVREMPGSVVAN